MSAPQHPQELAPQDPAAELPTVGQILRQVREQNGLAVEQIAAYLKLSPRQIVALEQDDYDQLPGKAFVRGLIRSYGRVLNLDPQALLDRLAVHSAPQQPAAGGTDARPREASTQRWQMWGIPLLLAIVLSFTAYHWEKSHPGAGSAPPKVQKPAPRPPEALATQPAEPGSAPTAPEGESSSPGQTASGAPSAAVPDMTKSTPSPGAASERNPTASAEAKSPQSPDAAKPTAAATNAGTTPSAAGGATGNLQFSFAAVAWIEVRDPNGQLLASHTGQAGSTETVEGHTPLTVIVGNADKVKLTYGGKPFDMTPYTQRDIARFTLN